MHPHVILACLFCEALLYRRGKEYLFIPKDKQHKITERFQPKTFKVVIACSDAETWET